MAQMNNAFIFSQLWLIIATQNPNEYDQKSQAIIPEINFLLARQKLSPPFVQYSHQQHNQHHLTKNQNHRFEHNQQIKVAGTWLGKQPDIINATTLAPESLIKFAIMKSDQIYGSNDTQLISSVNSSNLQDIAFCVSPCNEHRDRKRILPNNMDTSNESESKKDGNEIGFNQNTIDIEVEIRRKMERTTIQVRNYPPVTETTPSPVTANSVSINPKPIPSLTMLTIPLPITTVYPHLYDHHNSRTHTTIPYANLTSTLSPNQHHNWGVIQQLNVKKPPAIPYFGNAPAPVALPIPLIKTATSPDLFGAYLQNSGTNTLIGNDYFRNSANINGRILDGTFDQQQHQLPRMDDILGCAWDIVTNSCKDLFSLKLCSQCHDFGNIFLHNCKCLSKYKTTF